MGQYAPTWAVSDPFLAASLDLRAFALCVALDHHHPGSVICDETHEVEDGARPELQGQVLTECRTLLHTLLHTLIHT